MLGYVGGRAGARELDFMSDYIAGKMLAKTGLEQGDQFAGMLRPGTRPIVFSTEAQAVMDAGRALWKYERSRPRHTNTVS